MSQLAQIRKYSFILCVYGAVNMFSSSDEKITKILLDGFFSSAVQTVHLLTVAYGAGCFFAGLRMLQLDDWGRKAAIGLVGASLVAGLFVTPVTLRNLPKLYDMNKDLFRGSFDDMKAGYIFFSAAFIFF